MKIRAVYVCSPFETAPEVRALHERLRGLGIQPTSLWAHSAYGPEDFSKFTEKDLALIADHNDRDLSRADGVIVWSRETGGRETYAEARYALVLGLPVFWVGKRSLSAYRPGVVRCEDIDDALARIVQGRLVA